MAHVWQDIANKLSLKTISAALLFILAGAYIITQTPSIAISWVVIILLFTIYLFVFEIVDVDVAAVLIMVLLGLTTLLAPMMGLEEGLVDTSKLFNGFSSNAVMSIIAVMIIGAGLDKTGIVLFLRLCKTLVLPHYSYLLCHVSPHDLDYRCRVCLCLWASVRF